MAETRDRDRLSRDRDRLSRSRDRLKAPGVLVGCAAILAGPGIGAPRRDSPTSIDFESFANGSAVCAPCAVSDEWVSLGLRVSFRSWSAGSTRPYLLDGRDYLPDGAGHALGPALNGERGLEVGVIRLDFVERPRTVSFALYGPDLIRRFDIEARSGGRRIDPVSIERTPGLVYDIGGRAPFRREHITVRAERGIDEISLDGFGPPGHVLLIDDLVIDP